MTEPDYKQLARMCFGLMVDAYITNPHPDPKQRAALLHADKRMRAAGLDPMPIRWNEQKDAA